MMWQEKGCIMYEIFVVNFLVVILCPVFVHWNVKTSKSKKPQNILKPKNFFVKN